MQYPTRHAALAGALAASACFVLWGASAPGALAAQALEAASPAPPPLAGSEAAAWALQVSAQSGAHVIQVAGVNTQFGAAPSAFGAPVIVDGQSPVSASGVLAHPSVTKSSLNWQDPTGSMTMQDGYAQAAITPTSSSVRTGFGTMSGSSYPIAHKYFTWAQQQEFTTAVAGANDAIFGPLNAHLQALAPVFALLGVSVPTFQVMSPVAVINVGGSEGLSASARTTTSSGLDSADAQAQFGTVQLFDSFITLTGLQAIVDSQNNAGVASQKASVTLGQIQIAGIAVSVDNGGLAVAGNNLLARTTLQPFLDLILGQLAAAGMTLHFDETSLVGGLQEATAFEVDWATPQGLYQLSIAHAEAAAAPTQPAQAPSPVGLSSAAPLVSPSPPSAATASSVLASAAPVTSPATSSPAPPISSIGPGPSTNAPVPAAYRGIPSWLGALLPKAAASSLDTAFIVLLLGGVSAAVLIPMLLGFGLRRRAPLPIHRPLEEEVRA